MSLTKTALVSFVLMLIGCSSSGTTDCLGACQGVGGRCGGDTTICTSFCELRDSFDARTGCAPQQAVSNECESSAVSCGSALTALCANETRAYTDCNIAYCQANPSDALCVELCSSDVRYCP